MPELPEVQTIVNDLQILTNDTIIGFWTNFKKAIKTEAFEKEIAKRKIVNIKRVGKNVIFELDNDNFVIIHLKMTGRLILAKNQKTNTEPSEEKHLHHVFYLKKKGSLKFYDIRKFATLELVSHEKLSEISKAKGIDPLSKDFTLKKFTTILQNKKKKNVKEVLMDQSTISGIGNIYASEIPYDAKISPLRKAESLSKDEIKTLHKSIVKILKQAIKMRGTSFSDYRDAQGKKGGFQNKLKVYGKAGKKCDKCGTIIEKVVVGQRSTFFCPGCQK
jgi:formamidopyrimidine-DNA glycosylase